MTAGMSLVQSQATAQQHFTGPPGQGRVRTGDAPTLTAQQFRQSFHSRAADPNQMGRRLPFQIRGVVGGDMAYVLLSSGDKLSQGGVWQGWRLASVTATQVTFENGAQRAVLAR